MPLLRIEGVVRGLSDAAQATSFDLQSGGPYSSSTILVDRDMTADAAESLMDTLIAEALSALAETDASPPDTLYHFTDASGLIGIVQSQSLWLSMASTLNDSTEVAHGLEVAQEVLSANSQVPTEFARHVASFLESNAPIASDIVLQPFVTSFTDVLASSVHWMGYASSGAGFAIAFTGSDLIRPFAQLCRVEYDRVAQREVQTRIVTRVWQSYAMITQALSGALFDFAAHLTAMTLRSASVRMKNEAFKHESEWRLVTFGSSREIDSTPYGGENLKMCFRARRSQVVPYLVCPYKPFPAKQIIVGASAGIEPDDSGLQFLLARQLAGWIQVTRSTVPVR